MDGLGISRKRKRNIQNKERIMIAWVRRVKVRLLFVFGLHEWPHPPPFTVH